MPEADIKDLLERIAAFEAETATISPDECEKRFAVLPGRLLVSSEYTVTHLRGPHVSGVDVIAFCPN